LLEEGLFRGVLISHFAARMSLPSANMLQALLFGLWHIVWPLYYLITGKMNANQAIAVAIVYVITAGLTGLFWGYLFIRTNNLWSSWISHTINNSVFNLVHTHTSNGFELGLPIRVSMLSIIFLLLIPIVKQLTRNWRSFSPRKLQRYNLENQLP
jgi:membrane protease YdiL (CAAX protease family)